MGLISNGTTIFDSGSMAAGLGGSMVFIKKLTASSSSTLSFVDGSSSVVLDNTYKEYLFIINNCHPSAASNFCMDGSTDGGSSYGVTITSTVFRAGHNEDDSTPTFGYFAADDLAQSTSYQRLDAGRTGNDSDSGLVGTLQLFSPSSTTFVNERMYNDAIMIEMDTPSIDVKLAYRLINQYGGIVSIMPRFAILFMIFLPTKFMFIVYWWFF